MENMYFRCPVCGKTLHTCNKKNIFPINYKIRCRYCRSVFGFVPKMFVVTHLKEADINDENIADMLEFDDEDD